VSFTKIDSNKKGIGVIAQEVQEVLPEVVVEGSDGILSVAYGNIVGVLIEAIKEQQKQIEELKAKIGN
jgi:Chaperone of endosialidase